MLLTLFSRRRRQKKRPTRQQCTVARKEEERVVRIFRVHWRTQQESLALTAAISYDTEPTDFGGRKREGTCSNSRPLHTAWGKRTISSKERKMLLTWSVSTKSCCANDSSGNKCVPKTSSRLKAASELHLHTVVSVHSSLFFSSCNLDSAFNAVFMWWQILLVRCHRIQSLRCPYGANIFLARNLCYRTHGLLEVSHACLHRGNSPS